MTYRQINLTVKALGRLKLELSMTPNSEIDERFDNIKHDDITTINETIRELEEERDKLNVSKKGSV